MRVAQFSRLHPTAHPQGAHTVSCQMRSRNCRWKAVRVLNVFMGKRNFWLVDYAYADPGEPMRAGQTSSNETVPIEGFSWRPRAGSRAGLLAWRKSRSRAAR